MIPITPEILGPGIEEEYADALERITLLEGLLAPFEASNDTAEGRMVFLMKWLRQEIEGQRLPIPLDRKYWGTLGYLIGEGGIDYLGGAYAMGKLARVLDGTGLVKPRHYPVVVAMIDEFLEYLGAVQHPEPRDLALMAELKQIAQGLTAGTLQLPLAWAHYPGCKNRRYSSEVEALPNFLNRLEGLMLPLFGSISMIPITPEIMGPGIEEEYADALERVTVLEKLLAPFPASNDTREGRMVYLLRWLRQKIEGERLPIPLDRKYWGTLGRLIAEGSRNRYGAKQALGGVSAGSDRSNSG